MKNTPVESRLEVSQNIPTRRAELGAAGAPEPLHDLVAHLTDYYRQAPPPPYGLQPGRARVLRAIQRQKAARTPARAPAVTAWVWRMAALALALLLIWLPVGEQLTWAARVSLPNEPLYALKLAGEDEHFAHITDQQTRALLAVLLTDERIRELEALVAEGRSVPWSVVSRVDTLTSMALDAAARAEVEQMPLLLDFIARHAQIQTQKLEALKLNLEGVNYRQVADVQALCLERSQIAVMALQYPDAFRQAYQTHHPERMAFTVGGPLGGIVTPELLKQYTEPDIHQQDAQ